MGAVIKGYVGTLILPLACSSLAIGLIMPIWRHLKFGAYICKFAAISLTDIRLVICPNISIFQQCPTWWLNQQITLKFECYVCHLLRYHIICGVIFRIIVRTYSYLRLCTIHDKLVDDFNLWLNDDDFICCKYYAATLTHCPRFRDMWRIMMNDIWSLT